MDGVTNLVKRKFSEAEEQQNYMNARQKLIDDTDRQTKLAQLKQVSPWVPQLTPEAKDSLIKAPPKRPSSPMSGQPLRAKDLIPINLIREVTINTTDSAYNNGTSGSVKFISPVSR
jgi:hypothetical protein